jgi:hypothetical protein
MITQQTVFVFGAGVSMPYGFPSGKSLLRQISIAAMKSSMHGEEGGGRPSLADIGALLREDFNEDTVMNFGGELYRSQQTSIDAFLEHRPEFMKIGKTAIALCLARKESQGDLLSMDIRDNGCYQYLFNKMSSDWESFTKNKVAFITFNYDRSLEEYFFIALKSSYGKSDEECAKAIKQIPIVHVHGSLGPLPWQSSEGIPYNTKYVLAPGIGEVFSGLHLERMRDNIIVISEGQDESPEFNQAFELMSKAKNVYFLGFGYHPTNLRRLQIDKLHGATSLSGTAKDLEDGEKRHFAGQIKLQDNTSDSLLFLRRYAELN